MSFSEVVQYCSILFLIFVELLNFWRIQNLDIRIFFSNWSFIEMKCNVKLEWQHELKICLCDYWLVLNENGKEWVSMSRNPVQSAGYHNQKWSQRNAY